MNFGKWLMVLVLAAALPGCATGKSADSAEANVTISVDEKKSGPAISEDFSGLSFEVSQLRPNADGVRYFRPDNTPLIHLFHTLGIKNLRIGGNSSDRDARELPSEADLDSLFTFAKAADVKIIYCLRLHDGDPQTDAQTAKYIMDHYADEMDCFSIGQEPSAYPKITNAVRSAEGMGPEFEKYSYANYAKEWKKFADAIVAAVPDVKFCGPSVHNNGAWATNFIRDFGEGNHVVLVTEHLYPGGAGGKVPSPRIGIDRMLSNGTDMTNGFPNVYQKLYASFVPEAQAAGLPYRLEEVNNYFNGGAANVSDTFASALWGLDFMFWWAEHGANGLNFHTGDKVSANYSMQASKYTAFFTSGNGYYVRPLGYGIKAFDIGSHGQFLPTKISNPKNLDLNAYTIRGNDGNLYLTVINKEHGEKARAAKIVLKNLNPSGAEMISLTAPDGNVAATSGETLGGAEIENDGSWNGNWTSLPAGKNFSVIVPAASAAIIKLQIP